VEEKDRIQNLFLSISLRPPTQGRMVNFLFDVKAVFLVEHAAKERDKALRPRKTAHDLGGNGGRLFFYLCYVSAVCYCSDQVGRIILGERHTRVLYQLRLKPITTP